MNPYGQQMRSSLLRQKTLFLLAFASAKRIGELQGISYRVSHTEGWRQMSCVFVPEFVAKTQDPSVPDSRYEGFSVPALGETVDREGRLLCPVRAVRCYLDRTAPFRPGLRRLFLSTGRRKKEISKNTVSFWLRKVIARAYAFAGRAPPVRPSARETRALAPSLLFARNFSVEQVVRAGTWRRHTTFTRHYLRDVALQEREVFSLGPVVAAQQTL